MLGFKIKQHGVPAILEWLRENGQDPTQTGLAVIIDDDGSVILERYVQDCEGHFQIHPQDRDRACWKVPIRVTPTRPFPGMEPTA